MLWPKGDKDHAGPQHNVWRQSSNPLKVGPTEGYVPIDVQRTEHGFGGLTFGESKENKQTLLCNNCDNGNWWHALGASPGPCGAQFPGGGGCTDVAELWCDPGSAWGLAVLGLLVVGGGSYVGGGIALGRRVGGSSAGLQAHPHWHRWLELRGLVHDGVRFVQGSAPLPPTFSPSALCVCVAFPTVYNRAVYVTGAGLQAGLATRRWVTGAHERAGRRAEGRRRKATAGARIGGIGRSERRRRQGPQLRLRLRLPSRRRRKRAATEGMSGRRPRRRCPLVRARPAPRCSTEF